MDILIVDDISENITLMQALLEGAGYGVVPARNGKEALLRLEEGGSFGMILSDILMPHMDGFQFCRECKTNPKWKTIPFVIYTATYTEKRDEDFALALGADRFVIKPQEPEKFLEIIKDTLAHPQRHAETGVTAPTFEETAYLSKHNEIVIAKLEEKVAELARLNLALRESEALFKTIFHSHAAVKLLIDPESGNIIDANDAAARFYGWTREQLLNMKIQDIRTFPVDAIQKTSELPRPQIQVSLETQHRKADGSIRDVEVFSSRIDVEGKPLLHSIVHDITKRKQAEAQRDRLVKAIEQAGEAIMVTDLAGTIQYVNPAFEGMTGYTPEEALGKTPRILKSGEHDQAFYRDLWETIGKGRTWQGRIVNHRKDGTPFVDETTISPVKSASGKVVSYVAVKRDITEHLRASREMALLSEQLHQAQKLESVGRLAGGLAHDFNNMLSIIIGYGESVLQALRPGDPLRDDVKEIVEAGRRSAALTRQLLAFSRKQALQPEVLNVNALLHGLERMVQRLIGEDVDFRLALADDLSFVLIDPSQFDQIIINLVVNARDAMPDGGKLTIETANVDIDELYAKNHVGALPGKYVMISITDSGCGMDEETLAQVFEPFFTTKEKGKGTGLGLATVYGIVKQSGGNIWAYSEPGHGTTFRVYLPHTNATPRVEPVSPKIEEEVGRGRVVLVVEDEAPLRELLRASLTKLGFRVTGAANGGEALLLVEEQGLKPDIVITDVVMPAMCGAVLAERLRLNRPDLKVLFMSGYTDGAIVHHGVLEPGTPFIQKPFTLNDIKEKVLTVLRG